jgi:hypothetical protein
MCLRPGQADPSRCGWPWPPPHDQLQIRRCRSGLVDHASAQYIVLATRSDLNGEVEIEVHVGAGLDDQAGSC